MLLNTDVHSAEDFPRHEDSATVSTASDSSFSLASGWLRDCLADHRLCNQNADANVPPPTRVIDIDLQDEPLLPRLYLTSAQDLNMKYVALSHCWGHSKILILEKHMLETMTHGIDWSRLPRTFQDAMIVTRRLGLRYLWIDSLCIIQDSQEDWIRESGTMQNVYANCVLTIAASWGGDGSTGLFVERNPLNQQPCRIFRNARTGFYVQPEITAVSRGSSVDVNLESLEKRAWAVQERFLPSRLLSYKSFELQWDCLEGHGSETWPTGLRRRAEILKSDGKGEYLRYELKNTAFRHLSLLRAHSGRLDLEYLREFYRHWDCILDTYTGAQLTYRSDVFVAFSGITKRIEEWTRLTSVFGMWKEFLPIDLLWLRGPQSKVTTSLRSSFSPTWSWGSLVGIRALMAFRPEDLDLPPKDKWGEKNQAPIKAHVISLDQPSAAFESHVRIKIKGPFFCTKVVPSSIPWSSQIFPPSSEGVGQNQALFDLKHDYKSGEFVFCLLILERQKRDLVSIGIKRVGLVLARPDCAKEEYVRMGVWVQEVYTKDEIESYNLARKDHRIVTKEEDMALNAEEKTIVLR